MSKRTFRRHFYLYLSAFTLASVLLCSPVFADKNSLLAIYTQLKPTLYNNPYGIPVYISSSDENNTMTGNIYGILNYPFNQLSGAVRPAANWCDIAPQHLNIKACTFNVADNQCHLTFYSGRKFYEKADDVYQLTYLFKLAKQKTDYIHIQLSADEGPAGTSDYRLNIKAIPLDSKRSFIHFSYAYQYNFLTSMGMSTYLATLGRGKTGFSILGKDTQNKPVYISGVRGIIERNSVRYYLAIKSFLETMQLSPEKRFSARISRWFDLTEQYQQQLYEMDKKEYLKYKEQERLDQQRLQQNIKLTDAEIRLCH